MQLDVSPRLLLTISAENMKGRHQLLFIPGQEYLSAGERVLSATPLGDSAMLTHDAAYANQKRYALRRPPP